jgi:hypothetical protein
VTPRYMAALVPLGYLVAGCTSTSTPAVPTQPEATCPASVSEAMGAPCPDGLVCSPEYACGILPATATCTCTGGSFVCTDVTGKALDDGGQPTCPAAAVAETCPATETLASQHACTETGLACPYPSTCSANTQEYDTCTCFTGPISDGGMGLRFQCPPPCDYDAALGDAGAPSVDDATVVEAAVGDATAIDAPVGDAPHDAGHADASVD